MEIAGGKRSETQTAVNLKPKGEAPSFPLVRIPGFFSGEESSVNE